VRVLQRLPCEVYVKRLLPAIRAALTYILVNEYGVSSYMVSRLLGVTPATITNYLRGRRGEKELVSKILNDKLARALLNELAKKLRSSGKVEPNDFCSLCSALRGLVNKY